MISIQSKKSSIGNSFTNQTMILQPKWFLLFFRLSSFSYLKENVRNFEKTVNLLRIR